MSKREMQIEAMKEMNIDIHKKLERLLKETELRRLLVTIINTKSKKELSKMLNGQSVITPIDILSALEKNKKTLIDEIFNEPKKEHDMEEPIIDSLKKDKVKAYETRWILPKIGRSRGGEIDVISLKKYWGGNTYITGFELKCENSRSAIHKAFSQAESYQKFCDAAYVCFSPMLYAYHRDYIKSEMKNHKSLGVWIVGKSKILLKLKTATVTSCDSKLYREVADKLLSQN